MKKKALLIFIIILLITNLVSYFIGSHSFYMAADNNSTIWYPHFYNTEDALTKERQYCNAWMELTHYYLYDNNPANSDSWEKYNYWFDVVMESDFYLKIDSLNGGDWEDWYSDWTN